MARRINFKNQKGVALPIVVVSGLIVALLAVGSYRFSAQHSQSTGRVNNRLEATYTAKAGVEFALYGLRNKTADNVAGVVQPVAAGAPVAAGFVDGQPLSLDVPNVAIDQENALRRRTAQITITQDGTTADGLRNRYRIESRVEY